MKADEEIGERPRARSFGTPFEEEAEEHAVRESRDRPCEYRRGQHLPRGRVEDALQRRHERDTRDGGEIEQQPTTEHTSPAVTQP